MDDRFRSNILFSLVVCGIAIVAAVGVALVSYQAPPNTAAGAALPVATSGADVLVPTKSSGLPNPPILIETQTPVSAAEATAISPPLSMTSLASPTRAPAPTSTQAGTSTARPSTATATSTKELVPTVPPAITATVHTRVTTLPTSRAATTSLTDATPTLTPIDPTATTSSPESLLQRIALAEAQLRSGELTVAADIGTTAQSSARVRFRFGDGDSAPAVYITNTYENQTGDRQTSEYIQIGDQAWQRSGTVEWSTLSSETSPEHQLRSYLPHINTAVNPVLTLDGERAEIRWSDDARDTETTLVVDAATGIPRELRRLVRTTDLTLTVIYRGWNTPVNISAPGGQ